MSNSPAIWGPPLWYQMHMKTFEYPKNPTEEDKHKIREYFRSIINILPCETCKEHYIEYLQKRPIRYHYDTKDNLINWLIDFHNEVNSRTGKKVLSYKEARSIYKQNNNNVAHILLVLILILIIIIIIKNARK